MLITSTRPGCAWFIWEQGKPPLTGPLCPAGAQSSPRGCPYFLYIGTLQPRKNLERVVAAFARLAALPELDGTQLVLAGRRGWLYDSLFAQVEALGLADRVLFPGYVAEHDLPALYAGGLGLCLPVAL